MNGIKYIEKSNPNGAHILIEGEQDNFFLLSNRTRIKKDLFPQYFTPAQNVPTKINESVVNTDYVDPSSFFKTTSSLLTDLKKIDTSRIPDVIDDRAVVKKIEETFQSSTERQNKPAPSQVLDYTQNVKPKVQIDPSTYKVFDNDDDAYNAFLNDKPENHIAKNVEQPIVTNQQINDDVDIQKQPVNQTNYNVNIKKGEVNPAEAFFKTFKKNHKVKLSFDINALISEPDFVRMMSNNLDYDIFRLYAKETLQKFLDDINSFEDNIYKQLYDYVYKDEKKPTKKIIKKQIVEEEVEDVFIEEEVKIKQISKPIKNKRTKKTNNENI